MIGRTAVWLGLLVLGGCVPLAVRDAAATMPVAAAEPVYVRVRYQGTEELPDPVTEDQFLQAVRHVLPGAHLVRWGDVTPEGQCGLDLVVSWSDRLEERPAAGGGVRPTAEAVVYWTRTYTLQAVIHSRWGAVSSASQGEAAGTMSFARTLPLEAPLSGADAFANARWLALRGCLEGLREAWGAHPHDPPRQRARELDPEMERMLIERRRRIS